MPDDNKEKSDNKSEVEILATALADSSKEASASNTTTERVLGTLLAFSVLGNIALAGLNIKGNFFGTDIEMGGADALPMSEGPMLEGMGYYEEEDLPSAEWCLEMKALGELAGEDAMLCSDLYPAMFE